MHQAQLEEIQAREETLDSVMRETEEERQAALITSSALDEVLGNIRLQYEAYAEVLAKRVEDARGVLDAAAAQVRRASKVDASLRARSVALEAERKALDERTPLRAGVRGHDSPADRGPRSQPTRTGGVRSGTGAAGPGAGGAGPSA
ncbi:hypothetical protein OsJ_18093 [Oryza sativa Japonica Group]|uniref:Uncharacterized protein n=1 Tax=Oryza sativa subsp. japonica TaxID=39947 RepID=B9FGQ7_ORYSJ|nr:hypothetical protein OsJ_18093 [Oryza sativa Japonica Group]